MIVYENAVIVWTNEKGSVFNDITKADKYFEEAEEKGLNPMWQRIMNPWKRTKTGGTL